MPACASCALSNTAQVGVHELIETLLFFRERDASVVAQNRDHQRK